MFQLLYLGMRIESKCSRNRIRAIVRFQGSAGGAGATLGQSDVVRGMLMAPGFSSAGKLQSPAYPRQQSKNPLKGGRPPLIPPRGKETKTYGASVRATRKPLKSMRLPVVFLLRFAERRILGWLYQEPPRRPRMTQFPLSHALPSDGAPA